MEPNSYDVNKSDKEETQQLYLIRKNGKYGYISRDGEIVIHPKFHRADDFCEATKAKSD